MVADCRHVVLLVREVDGIVQVVREKRVLERILDPVSEVITTFWRNVMGELLWRERFDAVREIGDVVDTVSTAHHEHLVSSYVRER